MEGCGILLIMDDMVLIVLITFIILDSVTDTVMAIVGMPVFDVNTVQVLLSTVVDDTILVIIVAYEDRYYVGSIVEDVFITMVSILFYWDDDRFIIDR